MTEIVLIDLSSIAHPLWHMSQGQPDPNHTSQQIVARVRALASGKPHVAICCDSGKSFRNELAPSYKANRPAQEAPLHHQIALAKEALEADGFPIWSVRGFEADDLIATAVDRTLAMPDARALIVSADKDLLQLVGDRVSVMKAGDGALFDAQAVWVKLAITPAQVCDYLCLCGDASDNVKGAKDIGAKKAAGLLQKYGSIAGIYEALHGTPTQFTPGLAGSLREFETRVEDVRALIRLRTDVDLPFDEVLAERVPQQLPFGEEGESEMETNEPVAETVEGAAQPQGPQEIAIREPEILTPAPTEWERQLDPRSMKDAIVLSKDLFASRMFSAYGTPQAVLSTVMLGRELGLPAMASLRSVHVIEGRHALAASAMVALVLKSGLAEYFEPVSFDATQATYVTKRKGGRGEMTLQHTIEMAREAGLVKDKSGWVKNPIDMLCARASARLARMVYPDILAGLYTPEELSDLRESVAA